ncbi:MAG: hypothetical protein NZ553_17590 [Caldilinea sp.]|nr:hypothetical protein [Caldilinea sp.]MDW8442295.1 hypothetical protein [Caldilineaceae bacterium]
MQSGETGVLHRFIMGVLCYGKPTTEHTTPASGPSAGRRGGDWVGEFDSRRAGFMGITQPMRRPFPIARRKNGSH